VRRAERGGLIASPLATPSQAMSVRDCCIAFVEDARLVERHSVNELDTGPISSSLGDSNGIGAVDSDLGLSDMSREESRGGN